MRSLPMFSMANYDEWRIHMQVHLAAMNDEMWDVIQYGPIVIQKENSEHITNPDAPKYLPKARSEWNAEDRRRSNLDNQAKNVLYRSLD